MNGLQIRLNKLKNRFGFYFFLAADHKLSRGRIQGLDDISKWIQLVEQLDELSGIVLNIGSVRYLPDSFSKEIILQVMGSPVISEEFSKISLSSISESLQQGANCISTQINFEARNYQTQIGQFSELREKAHSLGIPVLIMINLLTPASYDSKKFMDWITYSSELGGDIIKANLPRDARENIKQINDFTHHVPPIVLSGDAKNESEAFLEKIKLSKECGFSGLCVGRNIFQHESPETIVREICHNFQMQKL